MPTATTEIDVTDAMARKMRRLLRDHGCEVTGLHVLVMVSGGIDSTVTAHLVSRLARGASPAHISLLYCDHDQRDGTDDLRAVQATADQLDAPLITVQAKPGQFRATGAGGRGFQDAAREWRYSEALRVAQAHGCDVVVTGHTADDQLETTLMQLVCGTIDRAGIAVARELGPDTGVQLVRPMLSLRRSEVESTARELDCVWQEDPTNSDDTYAVRNAIRRNVVPALLAAHEGAGANISRSVARLAEARETVEALADAVIDSAARSIGSEHALDARRTAQLPEAARHAVITRWLARDIAITEVTARHVRAIDDLLMSPGGTAAIDLPDCICVRRAGYDIVATKG